MRLDVNGFRYISKEEFRVLTAVEMGMKNHEHVPVPLIESIARISRGNTFKVLQTLLRNKLLAHDGKKYDGYRLTYHGYDYLALRALAMRGTVVAVGRRLGVGKESDVHFCQGADGQLLAIKLHRLGRISFRCIKEKRDYLQHRQSASWMYMARLAAVKEFAYMKALKDEGFPVPTPIDQNRHCVVMSFVRAVPLYHLRTMESIDKPNQILERLMRLIVRLARAGVVHGDFNEFNLMIDQDCKITLIDFPQIVHMTHANAEEYFDRDVKSIRDFFRKRMGIEVEEWPRYTEVLAEMTSEGAGKLAALVVEGMGRGDDALLVAAHEQSRVTGVGGAAEAGEDGDGSDEDEAGSHADGGAEPEGAIDPFCPITDLEGLMPEGGREALGDEIEADPAAIDALASSSAREGDGAAVGDRPNHDKVAKLDREGEGSEKESESGSDSEGFDAPVGTVSAPARRTRKRQTAKEARTNLQKQQKQKPARANNQKTKETRKAKSEIKEYLG